MGLAMSRFGDGLSPVLLALFNSLPAAFMPRADESRCPWLMLMSACGGQR